MKEVPKQSAEVDALKQELTNVQTALAKLQSKDGIVASR